MSKFKLLQYILWLLPIGGLNLTLSGENDLSPLPPVHRLSLQDGLPSRIVYGTAHDQDGLLWLGTENGLCRYDGYRVTSFTRFPQRFAGRMWRDRAGFLLSIPTSHPDSVEIFDPRTFQAEGIRLTAGLQGNFAGALTSAEDGQVYFATGGLIYAYQFGTVPRQVHQLAGEALPGDQLIFADAEDYLLYRAASNDLSGPSGLLISLPTSTPPALLHRDKAGNIWYSSAESSQLMRLAPGRGEFEVVEEVPAGDLLNFVAEDHQGNLIFGHLRDHFLRFSRIFLYEANRQITDLAWVLAEEERIISVSGADFRKEVLLNSFGGLLTTRSTPISRSPFLNFLEEDVSPGQFGHVMRGFTADNQGDVYANKDSRSPWWFRVKAGTQQLDTLIMQDGRGNPANQFGCGTEMMNYRGDIFGMSCYRGETDTGHVYRYRPTTDQWMRWPLPTNNQIPRWITEGRQPGELFIVSEDSNNYTEGLLYGFYPQRDSFALIQTTGPEFNVRGWAKAVIKDTSRQAYWIGTTDGLYRFNYCTDRLDRYVLPSGEATQILCVFLSKDGSLLLGTKGAGLQKFDPDQKVFTHAGGIVEENGPTPTPGNFLALPSNDIASIQITPEDYLIITTFNGMVLYGPGSPLIFTRRQGLPDNEFNTPALFRNPQDGRWYAGTVNGFTSFSISDLIPEESPYQPALLRYRMLDEKLGYETTYPLPADPLEQLVIKPSVSYFVLEFTIPDYFVDAPRRYQTQLVGHEANWLATTTESRVRYTRLPPGKYTFKLRGIDGQGRPSTTVRELNILILAPWYQKPWFYLLCLFAVCLFAFIWHQNRLRRLQREFESARTVQELELRSLRQQLNPHFLSNAMNAIREYIHQKNPEKAAEYLTDFNRLMRLFLESSRQRFTSVKDELEMLRRYVKLEQLRFPDKFTVSFVVDPAIDPEMDELPSLLLQPIVENAINHGLRPLEDKPGELVIRFQLLDTAAETLLCTISDNGIGRKAAGQLAQLRENHQSRATEILHDRLLLLQDDPSLDVHIETQDYYPEQKNTGTIVTVRVAGKEA